MFGFPLLLIPLAICNIIVFLMPGVSFAAPLFTLPLMSGALWTVTLSDAMVAFGLLLLLLEVLKSARTGGKYITDHLLAFLIFAGAAAEFVLLPQFANATFFLLTLIALVDFLSGIGLRGRRPHHVRETAVAADVPEPLPEREAPIAASPLSGTLASEHAPSPVVERVSPKMAVPPRVEPIIEDRPLDVSETAPQPPAPRA